MICTIRYEKEIVLCIIKGKTFTLLVFSLKYAYKLHSIKRKPILVCIDERLEYAICLYFESKTFTRLLSHCYRKIIAKHPIPTERTEINVYFL